jgi:hypothetical protein
MKIIFITGSSVYLGKATVKFFFSNQFESDCNNAKSGK